MTHAADPLDLHPRRLRDAFGCFGTGVTIVTAFDPDGRAVGLTANSFTSVSLDPPLLLFCLDRRSRRAPVFQSAERFAVNVLHAGQEALSTRFARGTSEGMDGVDLVEEDGAPVLRDAMAVFSCRPHAAYDGGDHCILIGRVSRLRFEPGQDPLIYFQGRYRSVHVPE
ncbi:MAG: flavin reductase family protein [Proteobacteria bacterium]|nr:flavin reductase family protein [Pseudomonadota bacterium]